MATSRVATMDDKKTKQPNLETSKEFQRFEDVTSKIFQVPINKVRALEKAEKLKKAKKDKPQASEG
jgi:hypothetical protein